MSDKKMVLEGLTVNGKGVLVAENPLDANKDMYESMVKEYLNIDKVTDLIESLRCLRKLTDNIRTSLDEIMERRDYIRYTCRLCPASARV